MAKEARVEFRLERWKLKLLKQEAARQGMTLAEFVREHLNRLVPFTPVTIYLEPIRMAQLVEVARREMCSIEDEVRQAVIDRIEKVLGSPQAVDAQVKQAMSEYVLSTRLQRALGKRYRPGMSEQQMQQALEDDDQKPYPGVDAAGDNLAEDVQAKRPVRPLSRPPRPKELRRIRWEDDGEEDGAF